MAQDTSASTLAAKHPVNKERYDSLEKRIPHPEGFINDFVKLFTQEEIQTLDSLVTRFEKGTSIEIAVAVVDSDMVNNQDFEDYTLAMAQVWGVGKKDKDNGILIVIAPELRRLRILNGYGIEKFLSDAETKQIIDDCLVPRFKEKKYFEGMFKGIRAIMATLKRNGL